MELNTAFARELDSHEIDAVSGGENKAMQGAVAALVVASIWQTIAEVDLAIATAK